MAKVTLNRDEHGQLRGDIDYGVGFPATVVGHILPIVYPCMRCGTLTLHVVIEQPHGLAIKLPFARKPIASTGRDYALICNSCTCTSGIHGRAFVEKLERRIVPTEICLAVDKFCELVPGAPGAYSQGFARFMASLFGEPTDFLVTCLSVYRREVPLSEVSTLATKSRARCDALKSTNVDETSVAAEAATLSEGLYPPRTSSCPLASDAFLSEVWSQQRSHAQPPAAESAAEGVASLAQESGQDSASSSGAAQSSASHEAEIADLSAVVPSHESTDDLEAVPRVTPLPIPEMIAALDATSECKQEAPCPSAAQQYEERRPDDTHLDQRHSIARLEAIEASITVARREIAGLRRSQVILLGMQALMTGAIGLAMFAIRRPVEWPSSTQAAQPSDARPRDGRQQTPNVSAVLLPSKQLRTWTDTRGRTFRGYLIGVSDGIARIQKEDGKVVRVGMEKFSEADQAYLKQAGAPVP